MIVICSAGRIVESYPQLRERPPHNKKPIWGTCSDRENSSGNLVYQVEKTKTSNNGSDWNRIPGELSQMSTGKKEV